MDRSVKMTMRDFFEFDRWKIGIAVSIWLFLINLVYWAPYIQCDMDIDYLYFIPFIILYEVYLAIWSIILYPFGCSVMEIYRARKAGRPIEHKILTALGILLFLVVAYLLVLVIMISYSNQPPPVPTEYTYY